MAGPSIDEFITELKHDAANDSVLLGKMIEWRKKTLDLINENQGGHIVSGTTNGSSFAQQLGIINYQWYTILGRIIREVQGGTSRVTRTLGRAV